MNQYAGPGLSDPAEQARLTPAARRAAERLRRAWALTDEQLAALVDIDATVVVTADSSMSEDQLERVGLLVGVYADLHRLHTADLADAWVTRPNTNPLFRGRTPLDAMTLGGLATIAAVHELLAARLAGA